MTAVHRLSTEPARPNLCAVAAREQGDLEALAAIARAETARIYSDTVTEHNTHRRARPMAETEWEWRRLIRAVQELTRGDA